MRILSGKEFCKIVEGRGWSLLRVHASHHIYGRTGTAVRMSIPLHGNAPLKMGLQRHLMKLAAIDEEQLG